MAGPKVTTCTTVLDLTGIPWAGDPAEVERVLAARPGILQVQVTAGGRRVEVTYDVTQETMPGLWNWLAVERRRTHPAQG